MKIQKEYSPIQKATSVRVEKNDIETLDIPTIVDGKETAIRTTLHQEVLADGTNVKTAIENTESVIEEEYAEKNGQRTIIDMVTRQPTGERTVGPAGPTVAISINPKTGTEGVATEITATINVTAGDGEISTVICNGDAAVKESEGVYKYTKTVTTDTQFIVTVKDSNNKSATARTAYVAEDAPAIVGPSLTLTINPTSGTYGTATDVTVTATVTKGDGDITSVKCNGTNMTGTSPYTLTESLTGTKSYTVIVTDSNNKTATKTVKYSAESTSKKYIYSGIIIGDDVAETKGEVTEETVKALTRRDFATRAKGYFGISLTDEVYGNYTLAVPAGSEVHFYDYPGTTEVTNTGWNKIELSIDGVTYDVWTENDPGWIDSELYQYSIIK